MSTARGYIGGLGRAGSAMAAGLAAFVLVGAIVAFHGSPLGILGGTGGDATLRLDVPRPVLHVDERDAGPRPVHHPRATESRTRARNAQQHPAVKVPAATTPAPRPVAAPTPARPVSSPSPSSSSDSKTQQPVKQIGSGLADTVGQVGTALGQSTGQLNPDLGQTVTGAGTALSNTINGTGTAVQGLLGSLLSGGR